MSLEEKREKIDLTYKQILIIAIALRGNILILEI